MTTIGSTKPVSKPKPEPKAKAERKPAKEKKETGFKYTANFDEKDAE